MQRRHFELLQPLCTVCRNSGAGNHRLALHRVDGYDDENEGIVVEGTLLCTNAACQREYPVIDGVPMLVGPLRQYMTDQQLAMLCREDFSEATESLVGDCHGPGSPFDSLRSQISSYAWDHWGEFDPLETSGAAPNDNVGESPSPAPGSIVRLLHTAVDLAKSNDVEFRTGRVLDMGCSLGRASIELARLFPKNGVLGIDFHFAKLRKASAILRTAKVVYPRRRVGVAYDRREFDVDLPQDATHDPTPGGGVDFWACDAAAVPVENESFGLICALNLIDCVQSPREVLREVERLLIPGGVALISCPYDWSPTATPMENWLGGHSQRSATGGGSAETLRQLLTPGATPASLDRLQLVAEQDNLPWQVRLHERSVMQYQCHLVIVQKR